MSVHMQSLKLLMSLLDENKENYSENEYILTCNTLKELYKEKAQNKNFLYVRIEYVNDIQDIIMQQNGYIPYHNFILKYEENEEYKIDIIDSLIYDIVFSGLTNSSYERIIQRYGGEEQAHKKMRLYLKDYEEFICKVFACSNSIIQKQYMAFYILDTIIVEYDHITDHIPANAIDINDFVKVCSELL